MKSFLDPSDCLALGLGAVMMDKERQLAAPLKASVQAIAPQLRGGNGGIEPLQPASVRAAFTQQQVSTVHLAQFEEPEPQFRIIQGDSPAPPAYCHRPQGYSALPGRYPFRPQWPSFLR